MSNHKLTVTQVFKATRVIEIGAEGEDIAEAVENVQSGAVDLPGFSDPRWRTDWELQNEDVGPV